MNKQDLVEIIENLTEEQEKVLTQMFEMFQKFGKVQMILCNEEKFKEEQKSRWRAKKGGGYNYVSDFGSVYPTEDDRCEADDWRYDTKNYFETREEALEYLRYLKIKSKIMAIADKLNDGVKIDWNDNNQHKYYLQYNYWSNETKCNSLSCYKHAGTVYCLDLNFRRICIEKIGEEDLTFYLTCDFV